MDTTDFEIELGTEILIIALDAMYAIDKNQEIVWKCEDKEIVDYKFDPTPRDQQQPKLVLEYSIQDNQTNKQ